MAKDRRRDPPPKRRGQDVLAALAEALVPTLPMAADPRKLKPGELCRIVNSTPLGDVLTDPRLRAHRTAAGHRIGDGKTIDLFRYAAWLSGRRRAQAPPASGEAGAAKGVAYGEKKERERARNAAASRTGRDIGALPPIENPERRAAALASAPLWCKTYFPNWFTKPFSDDHLRVLARMDECAKHGGKFAMAMPRGSGKTTMCEALTLRDAMGGLAEYVLFIGATAGSSRASLDSIKQELECNDLLAADFPEVCIPIRRLEGRAALCKGQLHLGERTRIEWGRSRIVLPTIAGSSASGVILDVAGLTGAIRGRKYTRPDGFTVRPRKVILDDPQTDASAKSDLQCSQRLKTITGAVLGLAGPGQKISAVCPCTVIRRGDVADTLLNRELHAEWHGERCKLIYAWPTDEKLWDAYSDLRTNDLKTGGDGKVATEFYGAHRAAMDAGAKPAWPERHNDDELSAIQHAVNLRLLDATTFAFEFQNDPEEAADGLEDELPTAAVLAKRINRVARGAVPLAQSKLTAHIDVQHKVLYWMVCGWEPNFSGSEIDYGTFPDQGRDYFKLRDVRKTLRQMFTKEGKTDTTVQAAVLAGVLALIDQLAKREFKREDGIGLRIERILVDCKDGNVGKEVMQACRTSPHAGLVFAAQGRGFGALDVPMQQFKPKPGELIGDGWMVGRNAANAVRVVTIDTNQWKTRVFNGLTAKEGNPGAILLHGAEGTLHTMLADHLVAETRGRVRNEKTGRLVDIYTHKPSRPDNHHLDNFVGCAVGASMGGCSLAGTRRPAAAKKKRRGGGGELSM